MKASLLAEKAPPVTAPALAPARRVSAPNDYIELKRRIKATGLLDSQSRYYWLKSILATSTVGAVFTLAIVLQGAAWMATTGVLAGFAFTQVALLAHDVGHRQAFRGPRKNWVARYVFGNLLLGVSATWWNTKHNQHHATPNHIDLDPDIQFPMIVFAKEQIASRPHWLRPVMAIQAFVLLFLLPFQALNMRLQSIGHLFGPKAKLPYLQGGLIAGHFALYGVLLYFIGWQGAIVFALVHQGIFGLYNSSVFASNHKGMPVLMGNEGVDFLREQVLTSRNVSGHRLTDFWYGGLNYQIEHHLFPTMPRNNLAKAQPIVRAYCEEIGVDYHETGLWESYREVLSHLHETSASLRGGEPAVG
jgi:fatty acid desaturase